MRNSNDMRKIRETLLLFCFTFLFSSIAFAGWFGGPSDYDECILESMKGVTSDVAARLVRQSCQKKFPKETSEFKSMELPDLVLNKIEGKAGITGIGYYEGTIFNGNPDWYITSLTVRIEDNQSKKYRDYEAYLKSKSSPLPPLTKGEFFFEPYEVPEKRSWQFLRGRGYKK